MSISLRHRAIAGLALAAALGTIGATGGASSASAVPVDHSRVGRAVFVQTDDPSGNAIVVYDRSADGRLRTSRTYATGGLGGVLDGSAVDHLASQGALALDRRHHTLYAVNAGSDTVTVFGVAGDRLRRRAVVSTHGTFPVSVAVHGSLVYVLNARAGGSVQGFRRSHGRLVALRGSHRNLGLDVLATPEFVNTPGQVSFSPDGSRLVVTTKANGNDVDVFSIRRSGSLGGSPTVNPLPGAVPFAVTWDRSGRLVLAEAGTSTVATFRLREDGHLTAVAAVATGRAATCWIVRRGNDVFASNAGSASLSGYRVGRRGGLTDLGVTGTDPGTVDATVTPDGAYLYVQAGAAGQVDAFRVGGNGSLTSRGSVTVPDAVGGEGIVAD